MQEENLLLVIAVINFIGFLYGIYYYSDQLSDWNFLYSILIIDCPLQALLVGIILTWKVRKIYKKENIKNPTNQKLLGLFRFLTNFTAVGSIKYGIWTMFVILFYYNYFLFSDPFTYSILFIAHLGLTLEGLALTGLEIKKKDLVLIFVFYLLNDTFDYLIGTRPMIPNEGIEIVAIITLSLTFICSYIIWKSGNENRNILDEINKRYINSKFISKFLFLLRSI
ncbi:MAG: DUF1405 domain-containing protein [Candidatus Micrarchaeia archaeon]